MSKTISSLQYASSSSLQVFFFFGVGVVFINENNLGFFTIGGSASLLDCIDSVSLSSG